jgi:phosphate starvation-inducible protein PhoH and related proteins
MEKLLEITDNNVIKSVFGIVDSNLRKLEQTLAVDIRLKSQGILIAGDTQRVNKGYDLLQGMVNLARQGHPVYDQALWDNYITLNRNLGELNSVKIKVPSRKKKYIAPKTLGQKKYIEAIESNHVTFSIGPAGTGKTYLAMALAVNYLFTQKVNRIVLVRPAISAGESLGFLPGDLYEKLSPYLRPLYDALYDMMNPDVIEEYLESRVIEIVPLAYMRGRTLNSSFIILDEAQNCTSEQLKMFLTRLGFDSKAVVAGDVTQSDLPEAKATGLLDAMEILQGIDKIDFVYLNRDDVVRHHLTQKIIKAYEDFRQKGK